MICFFLSLPCYFSFYLPTYLLTLYTPLVFFFFIFTFFLLLSYST